MWAWGTGVFQSEDAWDLRQVYLGYLANGDDAAAATGRIVARFQPDRLAPRANFWLALAGAQREAGRLQDDVRTSALELLAGGEAMSEWERSDPGAAAVRRREVALTELRIELERSSPPPEKLPRSLTPRKRIQAMMAPYWRRLAPGTQRVAVELAHPPPRNIDNIGSLLQSLPADQAWLAVAQAARTLRWQQAFCDEVIATSRQRLAQRGVPEAVMDGGTVAGELPSEERDDLLRLAHFQPERAEVAAFSEALWRFVNDDPRSLRPPRYPEMLRRSGVTGGI